MKHSKLMLFLLMFILVLTACGSTEDSRGVIFCNGIDDTMTEIYVAGFGTTDWGEAVAADLEPGAQVQLYLPEGMDELLVDILAVNESGDEFLFAGVGLADGNMCTFKISENERLVLDIDGDEHRLDSFLPASSSEVPEEPDAEEEAPAAEEAEEPVEEEPVEEEPVEEEPVEEAAEEVQPSKDEKYLGVWETPGGYLLVFENGRFEGKDLSGNVYIQGYCRFGEESLTLMEGTQYIVLDWNKDGTLYNRGYGTMERICERAEDFDMQMTPGDILNPQSSEPFPLL